MSGRLRVDTIERERTRSIPDQKSSESTLSVVAPARSPNFKRRLMVADGLAVVLAVIASIELQQFLRPVTGSAVVHEVLLAIAAVPFFVVGATVNHLYRSRANELRFEELWNVVKTVGLSVAGLVTMSFVLQIHDLSRMWVVLVTSAVTLALLIERQFARRQFAQLRATGRISRRIIIVGTDPHAIGLLHTYERNPEFGYEVVGFVGDDDLGRRGGVDVLGPISELPQLLVDHHAIGVVVSLASVRTDEVNAVTRKLTDNGFHVALSSSLRDIDVTRLRPQQLDGRAMIYVEPVARGGWHAAAKRVFDLSVGCVLFVLALPILAVAMAAIRLDSKGPVFFSQIRVGKDGRLFKLTKLRTMVVDAEERKADLAHLNESDGALFKIKDDPRITRVGRVLRKLSIDELPQLAAVLRGTMSMVGPRPAIPAEVALWDDDTAERLRVLPGLTGLWQVSGRSDSSFETYKRLDLYYVDNWSLRHDAEICARTIKVVLSGSGAA